MDRTPATAYFDAADALLKRVRDTQGDAIETAATWCADAIARKGPVHLFGTGHSRMAVEEVFPRCGMKVIAIIAAQYSALLPSGHSSGKKLSDIADLVIDNCAVPGDAMVDIPGVDVPVGPGSTIGNTAVVNAMKCLIAADLAARGQMPLVLGSAHTMGAEASRQRFEDTYNDYRDRDRDRVEVLYGA